MELDGLPSTVTTPPAVTLTFDLMNMSQAQVYTWPYFGEISSNIYEDIPFIQYIMVTACCDLLWSSTFDPKSNQQSTNPYIISVTKIWRNSFIVFFWDTVFTRFSGCTDSLTHGRTDLNTVCLRHSAFDQNAGINCSCPITGTIKPHSRITLVTP